MVHELRRRPLTMIENKISFAANAGQLSIYDTFEQAQRVKLKSDQLLYCGMVSGKKIMHINTEDYHHEFLPYESFILAPNQEVEIDFPVARHHAPTTCLAIEISREKINQVADQLNSANPLPADCDEWHYGEHMVHTRHNNETQAILKRIVDIFTENNPDRDYLSDLAISELTARLLRHQTRDMMVSFSRVNPEKNAISRVISHLENNLSKPLNIEDLCKIACMSRTKFFQQCKQILGCSPSTFHQQMRIKRAGELLNLGHSVTYVSYELGFVSLSHFSRCFTQIMGVNPSQFGTGEPENKFYTQ